MCDSLLSPTDDADSLSVCSLPKIHDKETRDCSLQEATYGSVRGEERECTKRNLKPDVHLGQNPEREAFKVAIWETAHMQTIPGSIPGISRWQTLV